MKTAKEYAKIKAANEGELLIKHNGELKPIEMGELQYKDNRLYDLIAEWEDLKKLESKLKQKLNGKHYPTKNLYEAVRSADFTDYKKLQRIKRLKKKLKENKIWKSSE